MPFPKHPAHCFLPGRGVFARRRVWRQQESDVPEPPILASLFPALHDVPAQRNCADVQAGWVASRRQDCPGRYLSNDTIQLRIGCVHETSPRRIPTGSGEDAGVDGARTAAVAAALSSTGTEHLYLMTTQPSASRYSIIATGVFTTRRRHLGQQHS
jgi:hypothetical protein